LVPGAAAGQEAVSGKSVMGSLSGLGLGLVLSSSKFSIDMLINFLQTQGNVKAISRPRLAVISGTRGTLRVGQSTTYVSKVGTNFSTSINQVTTETRDLKTGLDLALFGDFSDNTIYTRIGLAISEIVSLNKFTALGTDLTLPTTADREINTVVRARAGDMILLGGITLNRDSTDIRRGITQNGNSDIVSRSELVLALKAKVVNFRGKSSLMAPAAPFLPARAEAVATPMTVLKPVVPAVLPKPASKPAASITPVSGVAPLRLLATPELPGAPVVPHMVTSITPVLLRTASDGDVAVSQVPVDKLPLRLSTGLTLPPRFAENAPAKTVVLNLTLA